MFSPALTLPAVRVYTRTDVGRVRKHNEDASYADPAGRFFVVADGMGGHAAGEVASQLAVEEVKVALDAKLAAGVALASEGDARTLMQGLADRANRAVRRRGSESAATRGMGTTLEIVLLSGPDAWIGHVGDSRTYLIRGAEVSQLTFDQSVTEQLTPQQKQALGSTVKRLQNVLAEAIGAKETVQAALGHAELRAGDLLLSCSDGLYEYFKRPAEIGEILSLEGPETGLERLVSLALERGGRDNITGLVVEVVSAGARPLDRTAAEQGFGIEEAIRLMRNLPEGKAEIILEVVAKTLASADVQLAPIIYDATEKQRRIESRVSDLKAAIEELSREVHERQATIATLEADRDETAMVRERLEMAQGRGPR